MCRENVAHFIFYKTDNRFIKSKSRCPARPERFSIHVYSAWNRVHWIFRTIIHRNVLKCKDVDTWHPRCWGDDTKSGVLWFIAGSTINLSRPTQFQTKLMAYFTCNEIITQNSITYVFRRDIFWVGRSNKVMIILTRLMMIYTLGRLIKALLTLLTEAKMAVPALSSDGPHGFIMRSCFDGENSTACWALLTVKHDGTTSKASDSSVNRALNCCTLQAVHFPPFQHLFLPLFNLGFVSTRPRPRGMPQCRNEPLEGNILLN